MKKKDEGFIQYVLALLIIIVITVLLIFFISMRRVERQKIVVEDGLTNSTLAAALIDIDEYGTYGYLRSNNGSGIYGTSAGCKNEWSYAEDNLYNIFKENLKTNLNLVEKNGRLYANEGNIISGEVRVIHFWIYNKELKDGLDEKYKALFFNSSCICDKDESKSIEDACTATTFNPDCPYCSSETARLHNYSDCNLQKTFIKDFKGRWVRTHHETDDFYIYKYETKSAVRGSDDILANYDYANNVLYTPWDNDVINNSGIDSTGGGHVPVENMTIYATIEFDIEPMAYGMTFGPLFDDPNDNITITGNESLITVRKSVVVDVQPVD